MFDDRWIYWSKEMIDWPRGEIMESMLKEEQISLIVRRQMLQNHSCNFFWVSNKIVVDGVIRSDNRGNESIVPLYQLNGKPNLDLSYLQPHLQRWKQSFSEDTKAKNTSDLTIEKLASFIYALFHSTDYRTYFAEQLRVDYPRIFFPNKLSLFKQLIKYGDRLIQLHLNPDTAPNQPKTRKHQLLNSRVVESGYPKWIVGDVYINSKTVIDQATEEVWNYSFGIHQVMRKWLRDRLLRELKDEEIKHYRQIKPAIIETKKLIEKIDLLITKEGGFENAFNLTF